MSLPTDCPWTQLRSERGRPALTLGCMNFGGRTPEAEAQAILDRALAAGITTYDTANVYNDGASERIVGQFLRRAPSAWVATKVGLMRQGGKPEGLSRPRIERAVVESLERLQRDVLDLYYLHAPDPAVEFDELLDAMQSLLEKKQIRAWAISNFASWQVLELIHRCDARHLPRPLASQVVYNLAVRQIEVEYLPFAKRYRLHTTIYNPLGGGLLAGKHQPGEPPKGSRFDHNPMYLRRYWSERMFRFVDGLRAISADAHMSLPDLAYGWAASRAGVDSILVGPASVAHLEAALTGCAVTLPKSVLDQLAALQTSFDGTDARYAR
jgi:aryl-alcohol dehydrogenase-like predicted oxidoreductase